MKRLLIYAGFLALVLLIFLPRSASAVVCVLDTDLSGRDGLFKIQRLCIDGYEYVAARYIPGGDTLALVQSFVRVKWVSGGNVHVMPKICDCSNLRGGTTPQNEWWR